jgi:hypothetical protein
VVPGLPFHLQALKTVSEMKIIDIKPTKKFGGAWCAEEAPGVEPAFPGPSGKQQAIDYARNCRFGCTSGGEIHVYDEKGEMVVEVIKVERQDQY